MQYRKFLNHVILPICLSFSLFFQIPALAENSDASDQQADNGNPQNIQKLNKDEVKRFVTAIALIQEYYIKPIKENKLFDNAIQGMISNLDPHSAYLDPDDLKDLKTTVSGEFVGIGIELTTQDGVLKVISPLEGTPADKAGIKPEDLIIKINGQLVQNMTLRDAVNQIKGKRGTEVALSIIRKGLDKPLNLNVVRQTVKIQTIKSKVLENGFGYVRITFFQGPVDQLLYKAIENLKDQSPNLKGVILDLRNNPGGLLDESAKVVDMLLDSSKTHKYNDLIVYTKGRIPGSDIQFKAHSQDILNGIPMVTIINGGSASASEIVAGALQDYGRSIIVGSRSFGKGSVQTVFPLSSDSAIKLTTALYYTPSGREIQAKGIEPDVTIPDLSITNKKAEDVFNIDESDFQNHLANDETSKKAIDAKREVVKALHESELKLAKTDYQLYEALMILKGITAGKAGH